MPFFQQIKKSLYFHSFFFLPFQSYSLFSKFIQISLSPSFCLYSSPPLYPLGFCSIKCVFLLKFWSLFFTLDSSPLLSSSSLPSSPLPSPPLSFRRWVYCMLQNPKEVESNWRENHNSSRVLASTSVETFTYISAFPQMCTRFIGLS